MKLKLTLLAALLTAASVVTGAESTNLLPPVEYAQASRPPDKNPTGGNDPSLAPAPPVVVAPHAAGTPAQIRPPKVAGPSWWTDFSVSPYVAWRNVDFTGKPIFGAGIGFGYQINRTVGVHVLNSLFDEPDTLGHDKFGRPAVVKENGWTSGTGIDESEGVARADLNAALGIGKEKFVPFLLASYTHSWEHDDEAIGVGGGFDVRLAKNFAFELSYRVRSFFDHGEEGIGMAGLHFQW